jgi:opacity protein-like surface antigen
MLYGKTTMKRSSVLLILLLLTISMGYAQQNDGIEVSVSSGYVIPSSPMTFANFWTMQYGSGLSAGMPLSPSITLIGSFEHYQFKLNKDGVNNGFDTNYMRDIWIFKSVSMNPSADPSTMTTVSANLRFAPSGMSRSLFPYFTGGVGVMRFSLSEISLPTTSILTAGSSDISMTAQQSVTGGDETSAFFQFGMGLDLRLTQSIDMFVEARYASGLTKGLHTAYVPITGGIKLSL